MSGQLNGSDLVDFKHEAALCLVVRCYCICFVLLPIFKKTSTNSEFQMTMFACTLHVQQQEGQPAKPSSASFKTFGQNSLLTHKQ